MNGKRKTKSKTILEEFWSVVTGRPVILKDYIYAKRFVMPEKQNDDGSAMHSDKPILPM
jgi:hypothetical protein